MTWSLLDLGTDANSTAITSHTPDQNPAGGSWSNLKGTWDIQDNQFNCVSTVSAEAMALKTVVSADMTIRVNCTVSAGGYPGIILRITDSNNLWVALWQPGLGLNLYQRTGGTYTARASGSSTGTYPHVLEVIANGTSITVRHGTDEINYGSATQGQTTANVGLFASNAGDRLNQLQVE